MKKYAIAGTSGRGLGTYGQSIKNQFSDVAELVGLFDINPLRMGYVCEQLGGDVPTFTDFDEMIKQTKPDCVIVTTMDSFHHEYIVKALDYGCDVICEKPMTIDAEKTQAILDAEQRNGKKITVTFNYRFIPYVTKVRELIENGAIGDVKSVNYEWLLDRNHGADYFRRWHKWLKNGGGLLVTKATHHFDMVNWWIQQDPVKVFANGSLSFYGPKREERSVRCTGCPYLKKCELAFTGFDDITTRNADPRFKQRQDYMRGMYFDAEKADGYFRDQCLWADTDIYDVMSVTATYSGGAILTYSLNAFSPLEGMRFSIEGTKGRIEGDSMGSAFGEVEYTSNLRLYKPDGTLEIIKVPKGRGAHGGGDSKMLSNIFRGYDSDPLGHMAGSRDGAMSVMLGAAANLSIANDKAYYIKDLIHLYE